MARKRLDQRAPKSIPSYRKNRKMSTTMGLSEMSKTYQYRKVMKPMLERKRRARINKCLDELKDLMVATFEAQGEHITRLEKADILELTVNFLIRLKEQRQAQDRSVRIPNESNHVNRITQADGFRSGYIHAVNEVNRSIIALAVNKNTGAQLMNYLGQRLNQLQPPLEKSSPPPPITSPLRIRIQPPSIVNSGGNSVSSSCFSTASTGHQQHPCHRQMTITPLLLTTSSQNSTCSRSSVHSNGSSECSSHYSYTSTNSKSSNSSTTDTRSPSEIDSNLEEEDNVWRPW